MARFCSNCGQKLDESDRFCKSCGKSLADDNIPARERRTKRTVVYEGVIHNCPCCDYVIDSFMTKCPACGYEIRDAKSVTSVTELASKLERVQARQMPVIESKKSLLKMVIGKDFKSDDEVREAERRFERQKDQEKANLIINFPVPNAKEDMLEFMIMASSNINVKKGVDDEVSKAWLHKMEQICQRAKMTMNSSDMIQIKSFYDNKKHEIRSKKLRRVLLVIGGILLYLIFMLILMAL